MASEARPVQDAEKCCRLSEAGGGKEPSQPFSCSVIGSEGGQPTYLGARVSLRSCRPSERAARIGSVPATRSLGSAWPFRGRPRVPTRPGGPVSVQPPVRAQMVSSAQPARVNSRAATRRPRWWHVLGRSHHTCSWKERGEGREHRAGAFIFSGTRTVKAGVKTPADGCRIGLSGQQARIL